MTAGPKEKRLSLETQKVAFPVQRAQCTDRLWPLLLLSVHILVLQMLHCLVQRQKKTKCRQWARFEQQFFCEVHTALSPNIVDLVWTVLQESLQPNTIFIEAHTGLCYGLE
jgi:hypothetical protein